MTTETTAALIAKRVHDRRVEMGLTLREMADMMRISEDTAQRLESGDTGAYQMAVWAERLDAIGLILSIRSRKSAV